LAVCLLAALCGGSFSATAQVTDLAVQDAGDSTVLTWTTGNPPWRVIRSESPDFYFGNRLVADGLTAGTVVDPEAASSGQPTFFYRVLENGEALPPGFQANPPRPVPLISALTPDSGTTGDLVTIDGGNFEPSGATMQVTFDGLIADILAASDVQLTVEVPDEVLTGDVQVCRAGICSNRLPFKAIVASGFQDLSSIAFEPGTGSLWVADRGSADTVHEIDSAGTITARGILNQALLAHPTPADGNGRIYYCNSLASDSNFGSIEYIDSATNTETFFDSAGQSVSGNTAVRCEGLAANDLEPDVVYFVDGRGNTVWRIVRDALAHDSSYGNQPFTFNSPAGARFDSAGNLYVSSTSALYRILPQEASVELVASGFTAAAGIDLNEETNIPMLLVADEATGEIWLVNGETGDKEIVGSGLTAPVGVAFSENVATGDLFYDVAEPTRIVRLPDPRVDFLEKMDVRVLLSKHGTTDTYPSQDQTAAAKIQVRVQVTDKTNPAGSTVYFRLADPKDPSPYLNGHKDDNLPSSPAGSVTPSAIVDSNGIATVTLTVDPPHSGNNYIVEASLKAPPNFKRVDHSKTYTSWKRFYVEHDRMYRQGEFLTQTSGAGEADPATVHVASSAIFSPGDEVHVLSGFGPTNPSGLQAVVGETGFVASVGPGIVTLQAGLSLEYPVITPAEAPYSFIARRAGGTYDAQPSLGEIAKGFDDTFAEWVILPGDGFIPLWPVARGVDPQEGAFINSRTFLFFRNFDHQQLKPLTNVVQLVSAARFEASPPLLGDKLGLASADGPTAFDWSWVFTQTIQLLAPTNVKNVTDHAIAHELGHQLNVNDGSPQMEGHDEWKAWTAPTMCQSSNPIDCCLMFATTPIQTLGVPRFHADPAAPSQDLWCIRAHADDLSSDDCAPWGGP
jgi:hypothetical protein